MQTSASKIVYAMALTFRHAHEKVTITAIAEISSREGFSAGGSVGGFTRGGILHLEASHRAIVRRPAKREMKMAAQRRGWERKEKGEAV